jgi:hypothetical protein
MIPALFLLAAIAGQTSFTVDQGSVSWTFDMAWKDASGAGHEAHFVLPADLVRADLAEPLSFRPREASESIAEKVRARAARMEGIQAEVRVGPGGRVDIGVSGRNPRRVKEALEQLGQVRDQAKADWLTANGFTTLDGAVVPDHVKHVLVAVPDLAPVVLALGGPGPSPRDFIDRALAFVQTIPYEKRARGDSSYRRPFSTLGRDRGDCDSKAVLFLGLLKEAWPEVHSGVAYVKDHAFVLADISSVDGDTLLDTGEGRWVAMEPVGPALEAAGHVSKLSRHRWRWGWHRFLEVK